MKKALSLLSALLTVLTLCSCGGKTSQPAVFDKYVSYTSIRGDRFDGEIAYEISFEAIEDFFRDETRNESAIIRVKSIDKSYEIPSKNTTYSPKITVTKAKVLEIYYKHDELSCKLKVGDYIWLGQGFYIDESTNKLCILSNSSLVLPGYEFILYTTHISDQNYKGLPIFGAACSAMVPLDISTEEYAQIMKMNHFKYVEHDDICQKAIEKYINGNK